MYMWNKIFISSLNNLSCGKLKLSLCGKNYFFSGKSAGPEANLKIENEKIVKKLLIQGSVAFGEEYVNGHIKTTNLEKLLDYFAANNDEIEKSIKYTFFFKAKNFFNHYLNRNSKNGAKKNIHAHYDLGNSFYKLWLDKSMNYSSAIFKKASNDLYQAQTNKYQNLFNLAEIENNDKILEIGSGWGGFVEQLIKSFKCNITTTTISNEQFNYLSSKFIKNQNVNLLKKDYRDLSGKFDKIVSIEMFEAVGKEFWDTYFQKLKNLLNDNGIIVLQIITIKDEAFNYYSKNPDFIQRYIFPGGMLPSIEILTRILKRHNLKILENNSYSEHYAGTLNKWSKSFNSSLTEVKKLGFDDKFIRMWNYYLKYCESGFKSKRIDLNQIKIINN